MTIYKNISELISEANYSFERGKTPKQIEEVENTRHSYILGYIQSSYKELYIGYNDLLEKHINLLKSCK